MIDYGPDRLNSVEPISPSLPPSPEEQAGVGCAVPKVNRPADPVVIASEALLAGRSEVQIRHRGDIYRLTLTKAGKLILHK